MIANSTTAIQNYEDCYTRYALAKRDHKLAAIDKEPDGTAMGLDDWVIRQIKARVDREINRTC